MQETTDRSNGREKETVRPSSKLRILKGTRSVPLDTLSSRLYRQGSEMNLYLKYFQRQLGLANMSKDQELEADRIREIYPEIVDEVFTPIHSGKLHWPYQLGEVDLIKLAWAIHLGQEKILVPNYEKEIS